VLIETDAGRYASFHDDDYRAAGATIVDAAHAWDDAELVVKVKEPLPEEYGHLREGLTVFTYLHLAADRPLVDALLASGATTIAYETVQTAAGVRPLLYPMSEVAGCLAPQVGAHELLKNSGGRGVLMGGIGGVANAKVVVLGAGVAGQNAANIALGMGADVTLLDTDLDKLRMSFWRYDNRVHQIASSKLSVREQVLGADLVIEGDDPDGTGNNRGRQAQTPIGRTGRGQRCQCKGCQAHAPAVVKICHHRRIIIQPICAAPLPHRLRCTPHRTLFFPPDCLCHDTLFHPGAHRAPPPGRWFHPDRTDGGTGHHRRTGRAGRAQRAGPRR